MLVELSTQAKYLYGKEKEGQEGKEEGRQEEAPLVPPKTIPPEGGIVFICNLQNRPHIQSISPHRTHLGHGVS